MTRMKLRCTCHDAIGLNIAGMHCPQHSDVVSSTVLLSPAPAPERGRPKHFGDPAPLQGRVHHAEPVTLRPAGYDHAADIYAPGPGHASAAPCSCDTPTIFGHDTGCEYHPAPILADPLQLLVAAVQLISDQPTTEQWHTIKKAITDLVPSPFRSA